jgi:hypothetical protein
MFNSSLKYRVDSLCSEIANILVNQPGLLQTGSFQSQSQSSGASPDGMSFHGSSPLFVPDPRANWYPQELGMPSATGSQNNMRYAYFANARRLAVDSGGSVWVYDTLDHQIGGFSQQQGGGNSITFSSQFGTVPLSSLPVVLRDGQPVAPAAPATQSFTNGSANSHDVFSAIERLGALKAQGILSDEEFATKKSELLSRL